ncbi:bifunctional folylpolyglutamate synthase/dihydrofolate synthase [Gulosibacter molinativorax]|uniref:tetrahydrofolate synthase n=1 Tax=Gulosibacter molinativorax TaxID=256821 RepID=A0ABT7CAM0_9MICO|nr:folylpolyglutamate synthase/dihydrofolate synthase family protein [Gulosibacter molinativorax]MDJ1372165.1 bifunctional folylpolyglutamate synthase/dihydrofolate synthase [Gulosibacter molinativorax]QUY60964.1 Folylpolyglutamate synthase [Gulosibacter molinativorax]
MSNERENNLDDEFDPNEELTAEYLIKMFGGAPFDEGHEEEGVTDEELSERELAERERLDNTDWRAEADEVYEELMTRVGEAQPEPRLGPTRRACQLLGDIHEAWPMIHITGTNGKSSTARLTESILRAHGLRTGLLTSPHLIRLNERIGIDGAPITDERLVANWRDIEPFIAIVDNELEVAGEPRLTFFEALTVLAFACFTDAPIDVAVVEVGMGGEWDSTNVADGSVAVFTPISLDHQDRLGNTVAEIASTKAGIIKPSAAVVTAAQVPEVMDQLRRAAQLQEATLYSEPEKFAVTADQMAVGGRLVSVRGIAGQYDDLPVALAGDYQAHNAALAIAAVEAFFGGERQLDYDTVAQGTASAVSPGRLDLIGTDPAVIIDAAHNPHGAAHLAQAMTETYNFDELTVVLGVLQGKSVAGIIKPLASIASRLIITESDSPRAIPAWELADEVREIIGEEASAQKRLEIIERAQDAFDTARREATDAAVLADREGRPLSAGVLITGSITLVGEAAALALEDGWKAQATPPDDETEQLDEQEDEW